MNETTQMTTIETTTDDIDNDDTVMMDRSDTPQPPTQVPPAQQPHYQLPFYATEVDAVHESIQKALDLIQYYSENADDAAGKCESSGSTKSDTSKDRKSTIHTNPDEVYQQLDTARNAITDAWQTLYTAFYANHTDDNDDKHDEEEKVEGPCDTTTFTKEERASNDTNDDPLTEQERIRIAYLNMITDSFGNVLEQLNNEETNVNVDVLADCLQSGHDLLTQLNTASSSSLPTDMWNDTDFLWNDDNEDDDDDDHETPHTDDQYELTPHELHRQALGFQLIH
jgi:hypothetical protein